MKEETRLLLERSLDSINNDIVEREYKVSNWKAVYFTGLVGLGYGVLSLHRERVMAGAVIYFGGLLFEEMHKLKLSEFKRRKLLLEYALEHPECVCEYSSNDYGQRGGKHFKK